MFGLDITKLFGAIITVALVVVGISFVGDLLVRPKKQETAAVAVAAKAPMAPKETKEAEEVVSVATLLSSADAAAGKKVSRKCKSCHDMTTKKKRGIGPPLWEIVQSRKGGDGNFKYSSAMAGMGGNWTYEDLDAFIASPKGFLRGTKMAFAGIKNAKDRANLIAFLRSLSDAPKPLPQ
jgi:cytochrome c